MFHLFTKLNESNALKMDATYGCHTLARGRVRPPYTSFGVECSQNLAGLHHLLTIWRRESNIQMPLIGAGDNRRF